jgi:hypothetical protein
MFLFTTPRPTDAPPASASSGAAVPYAANLEQAAQKTGTPFEYLVKTAQRESGFDARAKAPTSSATGLFQFLEQTWLGLIKTEGARHGLATEAQAIQSEGGRFGVADAATRQRILALREDPAVSATMAGVFTARNREQLSQALGRQPSQGELYVAHFLGASGARELITLAERSPMATAAQSFPEAAAANRAIFYERGGRARTAREVTGLLMASFNGQSAAAPVVPTTGQSDPRFLDGFQARSDPSRPMLGLFRTDQPVAGPVNRDRARQWLALDASPAAEAPTPRAGFFPRDTSVAAAAPPAATAEPVEALPVSETRRSVAVPLPPERPAEFAGPFRNAAQAPGTAPLSPSAAARAAREESRSAAAALTLANAARARAAQSPQATTPRLAGAPLDLTRPPALEVLPR